MSGASWRFVTDCVASDGDSIHEMQDEARAVTRRTFLRYVDRDSLKQRERELGYEAHPARGLTMAADWHVSYHLSTFQGRPCAYFVWSAIEQIFCEEAASDGLA